MTPSPAGTVLGVPKTFAHFSLDMYSKVENIVLATSIRPSFDQLGAYSCGPQDHLLPHS